jgi:hypothetical protein
MPAADSRAWLAKAAPALDEDLGLVEQVGAAAFDQPDQRQLVVARQFLGAQALLQAHRRDGAALDCAVAGRDHAAFAGHRADADDGAAAEHAVLAVVVVHAQSGEGAELDEVAATVDQARHAFTRQQLAALLELVALRCRFLAYLGFERAHFRKAFGHARSVGREGGRAGIDQRVQDRHQASFNTSGMTLRWKPS